MEYFWCLKHNRVETDVDRCPGDKLLGPYPTDEDARLGLSRLHERNARMDEEDARWSGDQP